MDRPQSTHRTDEQLLEMLDESGDWVVNGSDGLIRGGVVATLRSAMERIAIGDDILAITKLPPDGIIVFRGQLERLISALVERKIC